MRQIIPGITIALGKGKYVRSDKIVAVQPVGNLDYGPDNRSEVLIEHEKGILVADRTAQNIVKQMTTIDKPSLTVDGRAWYEGLSDDEIVFNALQTNWTVVEAIKACPFGKSKFYDIVKRHAIDIRATLKRQASYDSLQEEFPELA